MNYTDLFISLTIKPRWYLATYGLDRTLKIWNPRLCKGLQGYCVHKYVLLLTFSQTENIVASLRHVALLYRKSRTFECVR